MAHQNRVAPHSSVRVESQDENMEGYEKIRVVGKGAFGTAVLYKKLPSGTLIVIKEINMHELTATERQMAINEVKVLSVLNHENIVRYHRSFERDGMLMIEMEYADGGTLAQLLSRLPRPMPERDILSMFSQIAAAIRHMHHHNILHRDLKTANVFLTKENVIKVGDFGISKVMTTKAQAQTVLGTPYYISPEMCEGRQYNQKSDIWALGCILYEMTSLKKPFQGSSLPALVNNIMQGKYQPIPGNFSPAFRAMSQQLFQRDPELRPTAERLLDDIIPKILEKLAEHVNTLSNQDSLSSITSSNERSVLYELNGLGPSFSLRPFQLPAQIKIKQVAVSQTHFIILTDDLVVLTWGEGSRGQLAHGDTPSWRSSPTPVTAVGDRGVRMVGAGDGFSVFVSDSGMLMTCGDGSFGCLGHSDWNNLTKPKLIEKLLQVDVTAISCGARHVAAIGADSDLYTWGVGDGGRLGLGHQRDICTPTLVVLPERIVLKNVFCGIDNTIAVTANSGLLACGRNTYNKLGLSSVKYFPPGRQVIEESLFMKKVAAVSEPVVDVCLGSSHTTLLTEEGYVITMGRNTDYQLGHSYKQAQAPPNKVSKIKDFVITMITAGPTYTAVTSLENVLLVWGTWYTKPRPHHSNILNESSSQAGNQSTRLEENVLKQPKEMLALYASSKQLSKGSGLVMGGIFSMPQSLLLLVHTTVPLSRKSNGHENTELIFKGPEQKKDPDTDSLGPVPDWIKDEVAHSEAPWEGFKDNSTMRFPHAIG